MSEVAPTRPALLDRWLEWLKDLDDEVSALYFNRAVWRVIGDTLDGNPAIPRSPALSVLQSTYATAQAVGVRRVAFGGQASVSFQGLLSEVRAESAQVTREWWLGHFPDDLAATIAGHRDWTANFAGTTNEHLDPALVDEDLRQLQENARKVAAYVDKVIAHKAWEPRVPVSIPTFEELYAAIDFLGALLQRYTLLLRAADRQTVAPLYFGDLMAPFRVAWLPERPPRPD